MLNSNKMNWRNIFFIHISTAYVAKFLSKLVKSVQKYLISTHDSQKNIFFLHLCNSYSTSMKNAFDTFLNHLFNLRILSPYPHPACFLSPPHNLDDLSSDITSWLSTSVHCQADETSLRHKFAVIDHQSIN